DSYFILNPTDNLLSITPSYFINNFWYNLYLPFISNSSRNITKWNEYNYIHINMEVDNYNPLFYFRYNFDNINITKYFFIYYEYLYSLINNLYKDIHINRKDINTLALNISNITT